ncbi:hypothetical protein [Cohnella terricola]|uniref:Uncharacterized protein n=1 Tax=Cohnella terricola TaxID=1289167 RepID=A0A559JGM2_9BACL|nr:hypothetical protein [Cohnella terricola]TVX99029.1 hypothetical protein FPZ45_13790 [Cohnella terricola]
MVKRANRNRWITANILIGVSRAMLPFYKAIALNPKYAARWSKAVKSANLAQMQKLLRLVSPSASKEFGSNGIGYFISFSLPRANDYFTNGTTIPPGSVQFFFETRVHRSIARSVVPLYRKMATSRTFAQALAKSIRSSDTKAVSRLIRLHVNTPALKSVSIENSGFALLFDYKFSKYPYRNLLFRDVN